MARQQPIELFMPPNMLKAKVGGGNFAASTWPRSSAPKRRWKTLKSEFADWAAADVEKLMAARARFAKTPDATPRGAAAARAPMT